MPPKKAVRKAKPKPVELQPKSAAEVKAFLEGLEPEKRAAAERWMWTQAARLYEPQGFAAFYHVIHGRVLPAHAWEWVMAIFQAMKEGRKGVIIKAFRGSWKTTTITITFAAWLLALYPTDSVLLVQVGDDIAQDNTGAVASIIQDHQGWKDCFPNIEPDVAKGWGAGGYEVKRNDIPYAQWREMNAQRKDPSLLGGGYKSREIIGKHPKFLILDDIHDENNTSSTRELFTTKETLTGTILPTMTKDSFLIAVGTPWTENDCYAYLEATGEYDVINTPVADADGKPTFPEMFDHAEIESKRRTLGSMQFARMLMLDLAASRNRVFKYMPYPHQDIKHHWPTIGGGDYAGTMDEFKNQTGDNDYFALAYISKLPGGGAVVVDGVLVRCTQAQAESYVKQAQNIWPNWLGCVVEGDGKGEEFIQVLKRNPGLIIIPMKTKGKGKGARLEKQMGPWLEIGAVRVSDADTPFLNAFRLFLDTWPLCAHDDTGDAVYWGLRGMPDVLVMPPDEEELPVVGRKKKQEHPFKAFARA